MPSDNTFYFRSDTRNPEEIFLNGFSPRKESKVDSEWAMSCLTSASEEDLKKEGIKQVDADSNACVCISTKFESAAIFPVGDSSSDQTYIYILNLSNTIKEKNIFDLHNLQTAYARNNIEIFQSKKDSLKEKQASIEDTFFSLYSYELFTDYIPAESIIGAVKISRSAKQDVGITTATPIRHFCIEETIFNEKFTNTEILAEAKTFLKKFDKEMCYPTTDPLYALGGKTLPCPKSISFDFSDFRKPKSKLSFFKDPIQKNDSDRKFTKNIVEAIQKAKSGSADDQYKLAQIYAELKLPKKAAEFYKLAAEQGHASAQYQLARCYEFGKGIDSDLEKALTLYQQAADQGLREAQFDLANIISEFGLPEAEKAAIALYKKAVEKDYGPAQAKLGWAYEQGHGVEKDIKEAVRLYHLAEAQREDVQYQLGVCYEQLEKNDLAQKYYLRASEAGNSEARIAYQKIVEKHTTIPFSNFNLFSASKEKAIMAVMEERFEL